MSRILMIGYGPLPQPGLKIFSGASLRTRQILKGILEDKHDVRLYTLPYHGAEDPDHKKPDLIAAEYEGIKYRRFNHHSGEFSVEALNDELTRVKPDAIVGVNTYASYIASMLATALPLWCDLNGSWMAEMQARCHAENDDRHLLSAWNIERSILRRLDKFSAVSRPHLHSVVGELASVGRLNKYTFGYPFGGVIPYSAYRWKTAEKTGDDAPKVLRGPIVPPAAFVILWSGSFKPSGDIDTLIQAMNELMGRYDEVHFVATGGATTASEAHTFKKFEQAVSDSPHKARYHLLGWVESEKLAAIQREADLGINIDFPCYETTFGARHRVNTMAGSELAILTTMGTEISEWIDDAHAGLTATMRDSQSIMQAIEAWIDQREKLRDYTRRATKMIQGDFTDAITCQPIRKWLAAPESAPDNRARIKQAGKDAPYLSSVALNTFDEAYLQSESGSGGEARSTAPNSALPASPPSASSSRSSSRAPAPSKGGLFGRLMKLQPRR